MPSGKLPVTRSSIRIPDSNPQILLPHLRVGRFYMPWRSFAVIISAVEQAVIADRYTDAVPPSVKSSQQM